MSLSREAINFDLSTDVLKRKKKQEKQVRKFKDKFIIFYYDNNMK